jgi:nucleoside-diphosphate-sugar epimerase
MRYKVGVTGGAGFIGSHVCECLIRHGHELSVVIDNMSLHLYGDSSAKNENLDLIKNHTNFQCMDLSARREPLAVDLDAVIHLAAFGAVRPSMIDPMAYFANNIGSTISAIKWAKACGAKAFIYASSSSVNSVADYPSPYSLSKIACDGLVKIYGEGMNCVGLKYYTVYGPRNRPDMVVYKFMRLLQSNQSLYVHDHKRDFIYAEDAAEATIRCMETATMDGVQGYYGNTILDVGTGIPTTVEQVAYHLKRIMNSRNLNIVFRECLDEPSYTEADISPLYQFCGYYCLTDLPTGLTNTVNWFTHRKDLVSVL